jgi:hypothetical protein
MLYGLKSAPKKAGKESHFAFVFIFLLLMDKKLHVMPWPT